MSNSVPLSRSHVWAVVKWSLMSSAVFWMIIYRLSQLAVRMPEFVYVNF